ncbi:MAG: glycosyltransferase family 9 protein [Desulfovibrio sp.]|nr:glycosyltransferase family 9 protein [Desulfovibrio sp.]
MPLFFKADRATTAQAGRESGLFPPAPDSVRRILVCQLRQIGDVLLAAPAVELLARRYAQAEIHVFTEKKCLPVLENNPYIHAFQVLDRDALPTPLHEYLFYLKTASNAYDIVADFQQLPRCRAMTALSRAPVRLSFTPPWYLRPVYNYSSSPGPAYAAAYKAAVLAPLGIVPQGERPRIYLTDNERSAASELLLSLGLRRKRFISVAACHRYAPRRWPAHHYAALLDMLAEALPDLGFFLTYGPGEEDYARGLRSLCRHRERTALPAGGMSLRLAAACMEQALLQIGNCSAPRHIAVALDVPSLTIIGAGGLGWTFPSPEHTHIHAGLFMSMPCAFCRKNSCSNRLICLEKLTPDLVFPAVMKHLREHCPHRE